VFRGYSTRFRENMCIINVLTYRLRARTYCAQGLDKIRDKIFYKRSAPMLSSSPDSVRSNTVVVGKILCFDSLGVYRKVFFFF
jgi:hypothetical protein